MTLIGRIRIGMAWNAWDEKEFARQLRLRRPGLHRQTVHKWFKENVKQLSPAFLFLVADTLNASPRWIALREGEPQRQPDLTLDQLKVVQLYTALEKNPKALDKWLREGRDCLEIATNTSVAQPFR